MAEMMDSDKTIHRDVDGYSFVAQADQRTPQTGVIIVS